MFGRLGDVLGVDDQHLPNDHGLTLISDRLESDGSFLLAYYLKIYVETDQKVLFVGFNQSLLHYVAQCKKLGINLLKAANSRRFEYINCFTCPYDWTCPVSNPNASDFAQAIESLTNAHTISFKTSQTQSHWYQELLEKLQSIVRMSKPDQKILIVFDNITAISRIFDQKQIEYLLQYAQSSGKRVGDVDSGNGISVHLLVLAHCDVSPELVNFLKHRSELVIEVDNLKTGHSRDASGKITILQPILLRKTILNTQYIFKLSNTSFSIDAISK